MSCAGRRGTVTDRQRDDAGTEQVRIRWAEAAPAADPGPGSADEQEPCLPVCRACGIIDREHICRNCGAHGALALRNSIEQADSPQAGSPYLRPPPAKQVDNKRLVFVNNLASGAFGSVDKYK